MEAKLFTDPVAYVSTAAFHADRERAPHLEQFVHRERLERAFELLQLAVDRLRAMTPDLTVSVVDLGCGDGGLLSLLDQVEGIDAWGYDFQPSNTAGWTERGVRAYSMDFVAQLPQILATGPEVANLTEVLEHLTDPHLVLRQIRAADVDLVCSSPWTETFASHDACHAWAWDQAGYAALVTGAGFRIEQHETVGMFQLIRAVAE